MIARFSQVAAAWARRWVPDPFVLAVALTAVVLLAALVFGSASPATILGVWGGKSGLWAGAQLEFTVQIMLVLVTGHALASTRPVRRLIDLLAERPRSAAGAAALVGGVAVVTGFINWGLSLIVGALVARQVGARCRARGVRIHYPLVAAAGYAGLAVWHGGLSGSAPLKVTDARDVAAFLGDPSTVAAVGTLVAARGGPPDGAIPTTMTLLSTTNLVVAGLLLVGVPLLLALMAPRRPEDCREIDDATAKQATEAEPEAPPPDTPAARLDRSRLIAWALAALGVAHLVTRLVAPGAGGTRPLGVATLDLDTINLAFLVLGLALHGSLEAYGRAATAAVTGCAGVLIQFPLYFGVMGVLRASGLVALLSDAVVAASGGSPRLFLLLTLASAGFVNMVIPSGGGQWAVQGPIVLSGAARVGADPGLAVMALAYGDEWTNLLQPFWALPLLGICGVKVGDIMGYTVVLCACLMPLYAVPLLLFG